MLVIVLQLLLAALLALVGWCTGYVDKLPARDLTPFYEALLPVSVASNIGAVAIVAATICGLRL